LPFSFACFHWRKPLLYFPGKIIFLFFLKNIWRNQKNKFIFALQTIIKKQQNMLRIQLHIEAMNCFSPKGDYNNCGACYAEE
jgi:hypothetical protein